jgi:diguanylate cyclase (GGDEF)-like protein
VSFLSDIFPSQSRFSRHWHMYLYRFALPVVALGYLIHLANSTNRVLQANDGLCLLIFLVSLTISFVWGERVTLMIDIAITFTLWASLINGIVQVGVLRSEEGIPILAMSLLWAPAIAMYWGMIFHARWMFGAVMTILYYLGLFLADAFVIQLSGKSQLPYAWHLVLAQGAVLSLMMAVFSQVAMRLSIIETRWRKAEHRASHDQLTGLLNKRTFARHLPRVVKISDEGKLDLSLVLIDFDHFKSINDRYGHAAGDCILQQGAKLFSEDLRAGDSLYRWGGEEFVIILRDTDAATLAIVAERLRSKTEHHAFGLKRPVTISVGLATFEPGETHQNFFKRADSALLSAKRNGRNRVEAAQNVVMRPLQVVQKRANGTNG